jgi:3-deoxy-D-manno-octulosonic-acid transferase
MIYFFYDVLLFLAYLVYAPFYCFRGRWHAAIGTRLGFIRKGTFDGIKGRDVVWIHAVSVGEARAAESLVRLIRAAWPHKKIVVSTVTPTGFAIAKRILKENEVVFFAPLDISFAVRRFLSAVGPGLLIIMETEIWPNLIRLAKKRGSCVVIVNGRISDRSFLRYGRVRPFLRSTFKKIDLFCMQNQEASQRIVALGAPGDKVRVTGNIKFDISSDLKESSSLGRLKQALCGCLLFIAGSTHDNEEEGILEMYKSLVKDFPSLRLLIAPRHLERIDQIRRIIRLQGLQAVNLSALLADFSLGAGQVVVVDTIGDLSALYRLCDVAYIGGSLVPKGGHNPIEPALFGKPILFGKHMDNFREIRDIFIREKAAVEAENFAALEYEVRKLLASPSQRKALSDAARSLIDSNRGAALRTFGVVQEVLRG